MHIGTKGFWVWLLNWLKLTECHHRQGLKTQAIGQLQTAEADRCALDIHIPSCRISGCQRRMCSREWNIRPTVVQLVKMLGAHLLGGLREK